MTEHFDSRTRYTEIKNIRIVPVEIDADDNSNAFERAIESAARDQKAAEQAALIEKFGKARREDVEHSVFE